MLNKDDLLLITQAIENGGDIWNNEILRPVKAKIKEYHRSVQDESCCYCRRDTTGEFNMVLDIEHVLPKGHSYFKKYMFTICNLSVSCKRCNLKIKGQKTDFIVDIESAKNNPCDNHLFHFIHPNSDNYYDHIKYIVEIENECRVIKYMVINSSAKGKYTYDFFRLKELEREAMDKSQGVKNVKISDSIDFDIESDIYKLFMER
ncbi:HNH endonuclease family protein [Desulforhopalus singaporensis]|uniref:HNH endonuclease n=1 Tax=Desulforhopalus singaporensis TaxID=91360 RepID=A0A1H0W4A4_9BACT|nr:hypothetical protein [Desulforhopalus singaporensis]SDP85321.1 hypothetical protein SAMN05660330_04402 [Desulforhopalus singaporensis]